MSKVIDWIFEAKWAITEAALKTIWSIANRERGELDLILRGEEKVDTSALSAKLGEPMRDSYNTEIRNGIAIIPVTGPIFPRANLFTMMSGATSLDMLAQDFTAAVENPQVEEIILNIDSPGGAVTGVVEMSNMIFQARGKKPITAYVYGAGASAAYWIASAADRVVVSPTAQAGSVGVMAAWKDSTVKDEKAGVRSIEIVSSVSPKKNLNPATEAGRMELQAVVDALAGVMVSDIARNRGVDDLKVLSDFGQGSIFIGAQAVVQGLADSVGNLEQLVTNNQPHKGGNMDLKEFQAKFPDVFQGAVEKGRQEAAQASTEAADKAQQEAVTAAVTAERERLQAIDSLPAAGHEQLIAENKYQPGMTAEKLAVLILGAQAKARTNAGEAIATDAAALAAQSAGLGLAEAGGESDPERERRISRIVAGANAKRK